MAHNINYNQNTGKYSFFSVQQKAWHGLGQIVSDWMQHIRDIKTAAKTINNQFIYYLADITRIRMNYHLLVISREVFLIEENPMLPKIEFSEGHQPFMAMLEELNHASGYFRSIHHIENLTVCLSLEYEMAHYINNISVAQKAMEKMQELVDAYELNVTDAAVKRLKADGPYHETFLKSFTFEGHALQKEIHLQRNELKSLDRLEEELGKKDYKGCHTIKLHPIGTFSFPKGKKDLLYELLDVTPQAREIFDVMLSQGIEPVANIQYRPVAEEGYVDELPKKMTPEVWKNIYTIRKKLYEAKFYRITR